MGLLDSTGNAIGEPSPGAGSSPFAERRPRLLNPVRFTLHAKPWLEPS